MTVVGRGERGRRAVYDEAALTIRRLAPLAGALGLLTLVATILILFVFGEAASIDARRLALRSVILVGAAAQLFLIWGLLWPRTAELRQTVSLFGSKAGAPSLRQEPAADGPNPARDILWTQMFSAGPMFVFLCMLLAIFVAPDVAGLRAQDAVLVTLAAFFFLLITEIVFMIAIFLRMISLANEIAVSGKRGASR